MEWSIFWLSLFQINVALALSSFPVYFFVRAIRLGWSGGNG